MRVLKPVLAVLCIFTLVFAGQTGKIAGRVTDGASGDPLVGTNVLSLIHISEPTRPY